MTTRTITSADLDAIAAAVAERVKPDPVPQHLTVAQLAERLAVSATWVYENAGALGAVRLGDGKRATLRFPASAIARYLDQQAGGDA